MRETGSSKPGVPLIFVILTVLTGLESCWLPEIGGRLRTLVAEGLFDFMERGKLLDSTVTPPGLLPSPLQ